MSYHVTLDAAYRGGDFCSAGGGKEDIATKAGEHSFASSGDHIIGGRGGLRSGIPGDD